MKTNFFQKIIKRPRLIVQLLFLAVTNGYLYGFATGRIYTGPTKTLCVPGLNCYSCPGALGSCPIGSLQAVLASRNYRFSFYVVGFQMCIRDRCFGCCFRDGADILPLPVSFPHPRYCNLPDPQNQTAASRSDSLPASGGLFLQMPPAFDILSQSVPPDSLHKVEALLFPRTVPLYFLRGQKP